MTTDLTLRPIAHIRSVFPSKFGIPRQSGLTETLRSEIVFEEAFRSPQALRGLSDFSHLWIIWGFLMIYLKNIVSKNEIEEKITPVLQDKGVI